ncbi:TonB-dependent receptor [Mesoflavibacter sp.]|uniref:TonB-dependent receptor n=1 Tax=Mesoflavibacter sp. TaxID=1930902 RepID=UPI0035117BCF
MKYLLIILAFVVPKTISAQNCTYTFIGEISDFHDATPIVGATVHIENLDKYVVSDVNGKFKIENLCEGNLNLTISHVACDTKSVSFSINSDTYETILLEHHIEDLEEVTINGKTVKENTNSGQETILKSQDIYKYNTLSLGDALKEVPGVSSINTGSTIVKPVINGLHSSRLIVLNNNVRLQDQDWGIEHAPNIDINSADQISVIKGSGTLAYGGDAIGGIIVVNPNRVIVKDTLYGKTSINGYSNGRGFLINSSLNKSFKSGWFANVQGSFKKSGDLKSPDYYLTNTGLNSKGITLRAGKKSFESGFEAYYSYLNSEIGILRASHIGNINDLINAINSNQPLVAEDFSYDINNPKQDVTHQIFKANYYKRFKNFGKIDIQYDYQENQRFEYDIRVGDDRDKPALDLNLTTHTLTSNILLDAKNNFEHNAGVLFRFQDNFANPDTGVRRLIPDYEKYDFGAYFTTNWNVNSNLSLDAGIRYDYNFINAYKYYKTSRWEERNYDQEFNDLIIDDLGTQLLVNPEFTFHNISLSAGAKYNLNSNSYINGQYSLTTRPPNPSELFSDGLHHSAARIELGDLRIKHEVSNRISSTYNYSKNKFQLNIEGFYNHINNFIYLKPTGVEFTIRGAFPVWEYQTTNAALYGLDLAVNYQLNDRFSFTNKSSFTKGNDLSDNQDLIDIPPINISNQIKYFNSDLNNLSISLKSEWVLEQTDYPNFNFETLNPTTNQNVLVDISTPPSAYHLLHFDSNVDFKITENSRLNLAFGVSNLLDTKYRSYLNRLRFFADDVGRNFTLKIQYNY